LLRGSDPRIPGCNSAGGERQQGKRNQQDNKPNVQTIEHEHFDYNILIEAGMLCS
jgi:hypothetical protein